MDMDLKLKEFESRIREVLAAVYEHRTVDRERLQEFVVRCSELELDYMTEHVGDPRIEVASDLFEQSQAMVERHRGIVYGFLDWLAKMPCLECGNEFTEEVKFCGQCGAAQKA